MADIFETQKKLVSLRDARNEYKSAHKDILTTKEEYIGLRLHKPQPRPSRAVKEPFDSSPIRVALLILMLLCVAICVSGFFSFVIIWIIGKLLPEVLAVTIIVIVFSIIALLISGMGTMGIAFFASLLIVEFIYSFIAKHSYKRRCRIKKENEEFNESILPDLIKKYEEEAQLLSEEYDKKIAKASYKIDTCEDFFKENAGVIAKKYYTRLDGIITVIDDQRASKLSDAINLVLRDHRIESQGKKKKSNGDEGLYPLDILDRMRVRAQRCEGCEKREKCIKLYCRMNAELDKIEEEKIDTLLETMS